jgi:hypothetical protein
LEKYSWTQQLPEVNIIIPVPQGTKSRSVVCDIKKDRLKVGLKGQSPIIDVSSYKLIYGIVRTFFSWNSVILSAWLIRHTIKLLTKFFVRVSSTSQLKWMTASGA